MSATAFAACVLLLLGCADSNRLIAAPAARGCDHAGVNLVRNGSFEIPAIPSLPYLRDLAGDSIGAWAVVEGPVDLISGPFWQAADEAQSVDLDGSCGAGAIAQRVPTTAGHAYRLCFALSGNPDGPPVVKWMSILWGGALVDSVSFDVTWSARAHMGWVTFQYVLDATADTTALEFRSTSPGCYGPVIDDVWLEEEAPPTI
ncbi:MAG: choice-of-anchor C family protein [Hyphomicrobiales bacterium]